MRETGPLLFQAPQGGGPAAVVTGATEPPAIHRRVIEGQRLRQAEVDLAAVRIRPDRATGATQGAGELVSRRFHELTVRFDAVPGLDDGSMERFPGVASVKRENGTVLLYTKDVPGTIGAVLLLAFAAYFFVPLIAMFDFSTQVRGSAPGRS